MFLSERARVEFDLDPKIPTLLVMGGSQGLGPLLEMLEHLHALPVQCLITTGVNRDLFRSLQKRYEKNRRIKIFAYSKMVGTMMDAADFLITKPGVTHLLPKRSPKGFP